MFSDRYLYECLSEKHRKKLIKNKAKTMIKRLITLNVLLLCSTTSYAQNIPTTLQGKWVSTWDGKLAANKIRSYCREDQDHDNAASMNIRANSIDIHYWEASETIDRLQYSQHTPKLIRGSARFTQSGFEADENDDLIDKDRVFRRKIEFRLHTGKLVELYWDQDAKKWSKRVWHRCA